MPGSVTSDKDKNGQHENVELLFPTLRDGGRRSQEAQLLSGERLALPSCQLQSQPLFKEFIVVSGRQD